MKLITSPGKCWSNRKLLNRQSFDDCQTGESSSMVRYWQLGPIMCACLSVPRTHGKILKMVWLERGVDVTSQNQLTQELQRREAYLAEAQRLSHTGSFGWNVSTNEHFWSEETFRIFEFAPSSKGSLEIILIGFHRQTM